MTPESSDTLAYFDLHGAEWIWCVYEIRKGELGDDDAVYFGEVLSPITPDGELGTFTQRELNSVGATRAAWADEEATPDDA